MVVYGSKGMTTHRILSSVRKEAAAPGSFAAGGLSSGGIPYSGTTHPYNKNCATAAYSHTFFRIRAFPFVRGGGGFCFSRFVSFSQGAAVPFYGKFGLPLPSRLEISGPRRGPVTLRPPGGIPPASVPYNNPHPRRVRIQNKELL
jgi:hypothetical protein